MSHNGFDMMLPQSFNSPGGKLSYWWISGNITILTLFAQIILKYAEILKVFVVFGGDFAV